MNVHEEKANIVKKAFSTALEELMTRKDLTGISINEICSQAGMSRTTFYRYFQDKYELSRWRLENVVSEADRTTIDPATVQATIEMMLAEIGARKPYYKKLFSYVGQNSLEEFFFSVFYDWAQRLEGKSLGVKDKFTLQYNASGVTGVMKRWLNENHQMASKDVSMLLLSMAPLAQ